MVDLLRNKWQSTKESPISIVFSGDPDRSVKYPDDKFTRTTTIDDIVGKEFNLLAPTSISKQLMHGMIELRDLQRAHGKVDIIVHFHGDILLLNEDGFLRELERFWHSNKFIAYDTVGAQKTDYIEFAGTEAMPQLFAVKREFCDTSTFLYHMTVDGEKETKATEHMLLGNLNRCVKAMLPGALQENWPYQNTFNALVYPVQKDRSYQWGVHNKWGGWTHFGNQLHYSREETLARNEIVLKQCGLDLSAWKD